MATGMMMVGGYRVIPLPIESPGHGSRTLENDPDSPTARHLDGMIPMVLLVRSSQLPEETIPTPMKMETIMVWVLVLMGE